MRATTSSGPARFARLEIGDMNEVARADGASGSALDVEFGPWSALQKGRAPGALGEPFRATGAAKCEPQRASQRAGDTHSDIDDRRAERARAVAVE